MKTAHVRRPTNVRSHRETAHLTSSKANVRRLNSAHAEIEMEISRRWRRTA